MARQKMSPRISKKFLPQNLVQEAVPWIQETVVRRVVFPSYCRSTSFTDASEDFAHEARRIEDICAQFTVDEFQRAVRVRAIMGVEEEAQNWSAAKVIEHLVTVGKTAAAVMVFLSKGENAPETFSLASATPRGMRRAEAMTAFSEYCAEYKVQATEFSRIECDKKITHVHPVLGPLDLHRWHCFSTQHLSFHRRHLQAIRRELAEPPQARSLDAPPLFDATPDAAAR